MPPKWPRRPTRRDPEFRKLDDRYTLAANAMLFATVCLGAEFFNLLWQAQWSWLPWLAGGWGTVVVINALWVLLIARYDPKATDKG
ncbi:MAG: hypothetical protein OHK0012_26190 [Synechococcales cyanobacterium]